MKFRQTAALGLGTLFVTSNLLLPYASATTMVMTQSDLKQFDRMIHSPLMLAMATQHVQHPVEATKAAHRSPFWHLNPLALLFGHHPKAQSPVMLAKSVAMPIELLQHGKSEPLAEPRQPRQATRHARTAVQPLNPVTTINPTISEAKPAPQAEASPEQPAAPQPEQAAPKKETYTQIFPEAQSQGAPANQQQQAAPKFRPAQRPAEAARPANKINGAKIALKKPTAYEAFQMMAMSPLDRLAAASKGGMMPALDSSSPDVQLRGQGDVTVLKSGISQKVTSVDLTIGKADVLYLSRPATRVSVSNPDVASAVVISPTQVQLIGKSVGVANLLIWGDNYSPDHTQVDISVHRDVSVLMNQLKYVDPGIQLVPMAAEDSIILTGQAESRESAQLAIEMAKAYFSKSSSAGAAAPNGANMSSQAPGSAIPGQQTNVINLIKVKGEPSTKIELVRNRLHEIDPNIALDVVPGPDGNEKVILTGRVQSASIASKALNLASVFYGQPGLKLVTAQGGNEFARMSVSSGDSSSSTSTSSGGSNGAGGGGVNMLQGSVMTDATGNVISMMEIAQKPQVKCSIKFLELNKSALNAMGGSLNGVRGASKFTSWSGVQGAAPGLPISAPSTQNAPGTGWASTIARGITGNGWTPTGQTAGTAWNEVFQNGVTQVLSINNQFTAAIQALQQRKQVRTLAEPTITMLSGEQGSFLAGGELPIAFVGGQGQVSIEYHQFGIRLNMLPNVTDDGKIQIQVAPEVSAIDDTHSVTTNQISIPAFTTRRMQTSLIVEPGQSFVLAGLYSQEDTQSVSRLPGAGSLPIIGTLFRNKWKNHNDTELVVIVKPEIMYSQTGPTPGSSLTGSNPAEENKTELSKNN